MSDEAGLGGDVKIEDIMRPADAVRPDVALIRIRSERPASREVLVATRTGDDPPAHVSAFGDVLHEAAAELTAELQRRLATR